MIRGQGHKRSDAAADACAGAGRAAESQDVGPDRGSPVNRRIITALCAVITMVAACSGAAEGDGESVVLVHGLGRSSASLMVLKSRLGSAGFQVVDFDYPSTTEPLEQLVDSLASVVSGCCAGEVHNVHFVTHSLGGVLVRSYLSRSVEPHHGRVVMLSPPNQGSEIIDAFSDSPLVMSLLGPAGAQLGTDSTSPLQRLGPVRFSLGIIAGDRSVFPVGSWLIPGPDDGLVGVEQTRVDGASDFMLVPATHTFIMNRADVADAVIAFLNTGRF